jgi:hypothetical protein
MDEIRAQSIQITVERSADLFFKQNKIRAIKPRKADEPLAGASSNPVQQQARIR